MEADCDANLKPITSYPFTNSNQFVFPAKYVVQAFKDSAAWGYILIYGVPVNTSIYSWVLKRVWNGQIKERFLLLKCQAQYK